MKRILTFIAAFCLTLTLHAQEAPIDSTAFQPDESIAFAQYDTLSLEMDLYFPSDEAETHPCIIYSYGGGFIDNNQRHFDTRYLCRKLADDGFVVIATNYRLGLKGVQFNGVAGMVKPLENAIQLAAEDVMKVTRYALDYASELTVDPQRILLMGSIPQKLMPIAERNQFAVEIYLPSGTSLEKTSMIADSLERMMRRDPRVLSVASFHGSGSPRFQFSYAPQMGGTNFAQFIVNTPSNDDTVDMLDEFQDLYEDYFPEAYVRFKQMSYSEAVSPLEVRLTGSNLDHLRLAADSIQTVLRQWPELKMVRSNLNEPRPTNHIALREDYSTRLGLTNICIESTLALRYGSGMPVASVYEDDDEVPVVIKSTRADASSATDLSSEQIPVVGGIDNVPLRQVADIVPEWELGSIPHRNGVRCVTVSAEFDRTESPNGMVEKEKVEWMIASRGPEFLPADVNVTYGGDFEESDDNMPKVMRALAISIMINFFILLFHYRNARTATLLLFCFALCLPGTAIGVKLMDCDFGCTCVMGVISLLGILVRNSIIMLDYTNELLEEGQTMCMPPSDVCAPFSLPRQPLLWAFCLW